MLIQLVRMRNIVVAFIKLLKRNVDDCRHTYSTWQCLLVSTVQPTPECLYHTFTSKTPCTLYIKINLVMISRSPVLLYCGVRITLECSPNRYVQKFACDKTANLIPYIRSKVIASKCYSIVEFSTFQEAMQNLSNLYMYIT